MAIDSESTWGGDWRNDRPFLILDLCVSVSLWLALPRRQKETNYRDIEATEKCLFNFSGEWIWC